VAADERPCDGPCGRQFLNDDLAPAPDDPDRLLCAECSDTDPYLLDLHSPDRWPAPDDEGTPPLGDPGEAGRSDAA
jgi:hypothetical protein